MAAIVVFLIAFFIFVAAMCIGLVLLGVLLVKRIRGNDNKKAKKNLARSGIVVAVTFVISIVSVGVSQAAASTPPLVDNSGKIVEESISELIEVDFNGRKQWISIRGNDTDKPVLLFLAGGPGGSQMAAVRHELADLEQDFIVVNWDQPGSGKSYFALPTEEIDKEVYIRDGIALSEYLCERFEEDAIYLIGESWGSALGIFLADERPDLYHAFLGTGQMVDFLETEVTDYHLALKLAEQEGNTDLIATLTDNGLPPYHGSDVTWKSAAYLNYLSAKMAHNPEISNGGYNTLRDLMSEEYGIIDKVNYIRGIIDTFNHVYPQLYSIDLRKGYPKIDIPVYFLLGKHDINAPTELVEDYFEVLDAPVKEIIWFEHSGHSPWINETDKFIEIVRDVTR